MTNRQTGDAETLASLPSRSSDGPYRVREIRRTRPSRTAACSADPNRPGPPKARAHESRELAALDPAFPLSQRRARSPPPRARTRLMATGAETAMPAAERARRRQRRGDVLELLALGVDAEHQLRHPAKRHHEGGDEPPDRGIGGNALL